MTGYAHLCGPYSPVFADALSKGIDIGQAAAEPVNWWLAFITFLSIAGGLYVGRWMMKKLEQAEEREKVTTTTIQALNNRLIEVQEKGLTDMAEINRTVTEAVTQNTEVIKQGIEKDKELSKTIAEMNRNIERMNDRNDARERRPQ